MILNMGSAPDDLTARARIREAAMAQFTAEGFDRTTVRNVAAAAGVSPALVLHHFGSKEGLRKACDEHVVSVVREEKRKALAEGAMSDPGFLRAAYGTAPPIVRYLASALATGSEAAAELFDEMVEESSRLLTLAEELGKVRPSADPHARAALLLSMQLGGMVLHEHLSRALGVDVHSPEGLVAMSRASLELFSQGLLTEEFTAEATAALQLLSDQEGSAHQRSEESSE
jgi:AcrR family transcriptional regulator